MPKIVISGDPKPEFVNHEEGNRIYQAWNDYKMGAGKNIPVEVNGRNILVGRIKEIILGSEPSKQQFDLKNQDDKSVILEFERTLKAEQESAVLEKPIEYYGSPHEDFVKRHSEFKVKPGYVFNEILGLVHWSTVEYAIKTFAIGRKQAGYGVFWVIIDNGTRDHSDCRIYEDFRAKLRALQDLQSRRTYAESHENRSYEDLVKGADFGRPVQNYLEPEGRDDGPSGEPSSIFD